MSEEPTADNDRYFQLFARGGLLVFFGTLYQETWLTPMTSRIPVKRDSLLKPIWGNS
jgi:hypothetical protein